MHDLSARPSLAQHLGSGIPLPQGPRFFKMFPDKPATFVDVRRYIDRLNVESRAKDWPGTLYAYEEYTPRE